jgi:hypothetical protein
MGVYTFLRPLWQALQEYGVCDEADFPYHDDKVREVGRCAGAFGLVTHLGLAD